jgi:hypothetical protein
MRQQFLPQCETASIIHRENLHGGTSRGAQSFDVRGPKTTVIGPLIAAWVI